MGGSFSRRQFLGTITVAGGAVMAGGLPFRPYAAAQAAGWPALPPVRIYVVYLGTGGAWPKPDFDAQGEIDRKFAPYLQQVQAALGDVEFVGGNLIANRSEAVTQLLPEINDSGADAILGIHLSFGNAQPFKILAETGKPVAIYSQPFSGHDWMYVPRMQKAGVRVILAPSRDLAEIDRLAALLRVPVRMKQSRIILMGEPGCAAGTAAARDFDAVRAKLGPEVIEITPGEFIQVHESIATEDAEREAKAYWISQAREIVEPSHEEIVKSCKTYLAMKKIMIERGAQATTVKCLGGIPIQKLGYPCLGFSKLLDEGVVGACEADMDSTLTMLMFLYAFGLPGFNTDPLNDTAKNAVIHAHCVAPTKMHGPASERLPFSIRNHRDDNLGASLEVFMDKDLGQKVTWAKLANLDTILVTTGTITEICDFDDRGCRTQLVAGVDNARALLQNWGAGVLPDDMMTLLHRVLFYGDHSENIKDLAHLMGLRVLLEGKEMV
ncbi:MAG: twin-arginine translocation signal domain-containing protein [Candidatus Hydrogenedentes bacterium]|nr:twin-arginine translocation signal domain-containing protein [Candidatus Hydrogenedentota bacterium]